MKRIILSLLVASLFATAAFAGEVKSDRPVTCKKTIVELRPDWQRTLSFHLLDETSTSTRTDIIHTTRGVEGFVEALDEYRKTVDDFDADVINLTQVTQPALANAEILCTDDKGHWLKVAYDGEYSKIAFTSDLSPLVKF